MSSITIRHSTNRDSAAVVRLAGLDEGPMPEGDSLLAFVDGELAAARPLDNGTALADPFRHTAYLLDLLELRATQEMAA